MSTVSPNALVLWHEGLTGQAVSQIRVQRGSALLQSTRGTNRNGGVSVFFQATPGPTGIAHWGSSGGSSTADFHTLTVAIRPL